MGNFIIKKVQQELKNRTLYIKYRKFWKFSHISYSAGKQKNMHRMSRYSWKISQLYNYLKTKDAQEWLILQYFFNTPNIFRS